MEPADAGRVEDAMSAERSEKPADDPLAQLERAFIAEYLHDRGLTLAALQELPEEQANALLREASLSASGRLSEVESRAHFVDDLHHTPQPMRGGTRRRPA